MRAIDADALRANFPEPKDWRDPEQALVHITGIWAEIDVAPTIEPERKKGKWIPQDFNKHYGMTSTAVYYYPKCSMCGESANYTNFCPNCGSYNGGDEDVDE